MHRDVDVGRRRTVACVVVLMAAFISGCVTEEAEEDLPQIHIEPRAWAWPVGTDNVFSVSFTNTADRTFAFTSPDSCPFDVFVQDLPAHGERFELRRVCLQAVTDFSIGPGETVAATYEWDGRLSPFAGDVAAPGTYAVEARFAGSGPWDASNAVVVTLLAENDTASGEGEDAPPSDDRAGENATQNGSLPRIQVLPGADSWSQGEETTIRILFENTANETYRYTSSDTCADIVVHARETGGPHDGDTRLWPPDTGPYACGEAITDHEVPPGGTVELTVTWDGSKEWGTEGPYVAPGTYTVHADFEHIGEPGWDAHGTADVTIAP